MYKLINHIANREPILNLFGIRSSIKDSFQLKKLNSLSIVEKKLIEICKKNQWKEACAIAFILRGTNQLINCIIGDIGTFYSCNDPIIYRKYLRPNILQVVIHFHQNGHIQFSPIDNLTDSSRFFYRKDDWSYIISLDKNGEIIRSKIKKNSFF